MKLDIKKILFKNFYSFGNIPIEWNIEPGIHLITGKNLITGSGNACGKSSCSKSIPFSLFGKLKDVNQSQIVNWKNRKALETEIIFNKGEQEYKIQRGIKPNILKVFVDNTEIDQPSSKISFQDYIEQDILGFDYDSFMNLIYADLNNFTSIFNIAKPLKRKFLEQLFNLESFSKVSESCKEKISSLNISLAELKSNITSTTENIKNKNELLISLEGSLSKFISFEREYKEFQNSLKIYDVSKLNNEKSIINAKILVEEIEKIKLAKKVSLLEKKAAILLDKTVLKREYISDITFNEEKYKNIEIELSKFQNETFNVDSQYEKLKEYNEKSSIKRAEKNKIDDEIIELEVKIDILQNSLEELEKNSICPTCKQKISKNTLTHDKKQLNKLNIQLKKLSKQQKILNVEIKEILQNIEIIHENIDSIKENEQKYKTLQQEFELLRRDKIESENNDVRKKELEKNCKIHKIISSKYTKWNKIYEDVCKNYFDLKEELSFIDEKLHEYSLIESKKEVYEKTYNENLESKKEIKEKISKISVEIESLQSNLIEYNKEINQKSKLKDYIEFIKNSCKDENIKQFAISKFIPFLNTKVNSYISEAGQNFQLKLNNWLDLEIKGVGIGENSQYGNLSGGERRIVDLAMQMSFLDIAKLQAKSQPNILLLDELLDTSVDSINLQRLLKIIKKKQIDDNLSVYIISHRTEIENLNINSVLYVTKETTGYSKLEIIK